MRAACEDVGSTKRKPLVKDQPCSANGCSNQALLRSMGGPACNRHYQLWLKHGAFENPNPRVKVTDFTCAHCGCASSRSYHIKRARRERPQYCSPACFSAGVKARAVARRPDRFWSKVDVGNPDQCWPYTGGKSEHGYGRFQWEDGRPRLAHRVAYELAAGKSAGRKFVCHSCDNPPCCNPKHLWLGTAIDNNADRHAKGRTRTATRRGEDAKHAKLTTSQVLEVFFSSEPVGEAAARLGVTKQAISAIRNGKNWAHVTGGGAHA